MTICCCGSDLSIGIRQSIQEGRVTGPRIFACNQIISQTGGHADIHCFPVDAVRKQAPFFRIADGVDECLRAVREQIRTGADLIKICTSGGVSSERDSPRLQQFTSAEIRTMVEEAHRSGRRVVSHAQGIDGVRAAVESGVDWIAHGGQIDDKVMALMKRKGTVLVPTLSVLHVLLKHAGDFGGTSSAIEKAEQVYRGCVASAKKAYRAGVTIGMGTDFAGGKMFPHGANALEIELLAARVGMTPRDALKTATVNAAKALGMEGRLGCVRKGAMADILVVDGNPLKDLTILQDPQRIKMVVQEGRVAVSRISQ